MIFYFIFLTIFLFITSAANRHKVNMNRIGCGDTKGCLFKPAGCDPQLDCTIGIIFYVSDVNKLTIQLVAQSLLPSPNYQYIAIGFSRDELMTEHSTLFSEIEGEIIDGRLMCQFSQQIVPQMNNKNGLIWNINEKYFIIGATGSAQPDEINAHDTASGSHFYPVATARPTNPSLVGPKIYELPASFRQVNSKEKKDNLDSVEDNWTVKQQVYTDDSDNVENFSIFRTKISLILLFLATITHICVYQFFTIF